MKYESYLSYVFFGQNALLYFFDHIISLYYNITNTRVIKNQHNLSL